MEYSYLQIVENIWGKKRKRATQRAVFSIPGAEGLELRYLYRAFDILYENKEMIERAFRTPKSSLETPDKREQISKRGTPLKNPATRAFPRGSILSMVRLSDGDQGQTRIFRGFKDLEPSPQILPGLPKYTSVDPAQEVGYK
ncbi:MAG: hypothetical protein ACP5QG_07635 [candidate division WOR-3 bacterium]